MNYHFGHSLAMYKTLEEACDGFPKAEREYVKCYIEKKDVDEFVRERLRNVKAKLIASEGWKPSSFLAIDAYLSEVETMTHYEEIKVLADNMANAIKIWQKQVEQFAGDYHPGNYKQLVDSLNKYCEIIQK